MYKYPLRLLLEVLMPQSREDALLARAPREYLERFARREIEAPEGAYAMLQYKNSRVRSAVHALKYRGQTRAASLLAYPVTPLLADLLAEERLFGRYTETLLVPVPLSATRMKARGYNQAEQIAQSLATELADDSVAVRSDLVHRTHDTTPQTQQRNKKSRLQNMHGVFKAKTLPPGTDIVLIDDVVTTGATLADARRALNEAGARTVLMLAAAH